MGLLCYCCNSYFLWYGQSAAQRLSAIPTAVVFATPQDSKLHHQNSVAMWPNLGEGEEFDFFLKDKNGSSFPPIPILTAPPQHTHYGKIIALLDSLKGLSWRSGIQTLMQTLSSKHCSFLAWNNSGKRLGLGNKLKSFIQKWALNVLQRIPSSFPFIVFWVQTKHPAILSWLLCHNGERKGKIRSCFLVRKIQLTIGPIQFYDSFPLSQGNTTDSKAYPVNFNSLKRDRLAVRQSSSKLIRDLKVNTNLEIQSGNQCWSFTTGGILYLSYTDQQASPMLYFASNVTSRWVSKIMPHTVFCNSQDGTWP